MQFPDSAEIKVADLPDRPPLETAVFAEKLASLQDLLAQKAPRTVIVVIDDLTRPLKMEPLLKLLVSVLTNYGLNGASIKFLVGLGGHRPLNKEDLIKKVGREIYEAFTFINHNPFEELADTGLSWKGTAVQLNRHFLEADFRIVISGLVPHSFAGFSGGAKMLFPGISNFAVVERTHKSVLMGFMGKLGEMENNLFRKEIEALTRQIGIDFFIGLVGNPRREIAYLACGDFVAAHREAAQYARDYYTVELPDELFDVVLLNAYPKDTELLQLENAFHPLHSSSRPFLEKGGVVLVTSACSEGMGHHELFGPGKTLYRKPQRKRFLSELDFLLFSENIDQNEFDQLFHSDYRLYTDWQGIGVYLQSKFAAGMRVLVFPYASLQLVK